MNSIKVSIVCITYNHAQFIDRAISGFLMQKTKFKTEILIHDDASTDGTTEILNKYQDIDNINIITQKENQYRKEVKISGSILYPLVRGEYIAICEGDDYWTDENKLQMQVEYMDKFSNCSVTCHSAHEITYGDNKLRFGSPFRNSKEFNLADFNRRKTIIETCSLVIRKSALLPLPSYYFKSSVGDLPIMIHLLTKGYGYYFNKIMATHLYMVPGSWSEENSKKNSYEQIKRLEERIELFNNFNIETNYEYYKEAEYEINRYNYLISIQKNSMINALRYRMNFQTDIRSSFRDYTLILFPRFYRFLQIIRYKMRRQIIWKDSNGYNES